MLSMNMIIIISFLLIILISVGIMFYFILRKENYNQSKCMPIDNCNEIRGNKYIGMNISGFDHTDPLDDGTS